MTTSSTEIFSILVFYRQLPVGGLGKCSALIQVLLLLHGQTHEFH